MLRQCRRHISTAGLLSFIKPKPRLKVDPSISKIPTDAGINEYMRSLSAFSPDDLNQALGDPRVRSTPVEAAVRMLADHFMMYESMDRVKMSEELDSTFGRDDEEGSVFDNQDILPLQEELKQKFSKRYMDIGKKREYIEYLDVVQYGAAGSSPQYKSMSRQQAYSELNSYLKDINPEELQGLSEMLMSANNVPDLHVFHMLIRTLQDLRLTKPAQIALDCLILSDVSLSPETLTLALSLASSNGQFNRFIQFTRVFPDMCKVTHKLDERMSSVPLGRWYKQKQLDKDLQRRLFRSTNINNDPQRFSSVFGALLEGFYRFQCYEHIDRALTVMLTTHVPLSAAILTVNFKTAYRQSDRKRLKWTWNRMKSLRDKDEKLWKAAIKAAGSLDPSLATEISDAYSRYQKA